MFERTIGTVTNVRLHRYNTVTLERMGVNMKQSSRELAMSAS